MIPTNNNDRNWSPPSYFSMPSPNQRQRRRRKLRKKLPSARFVNFKRLPNRILNLLFSPPPIIDRPPTTVQTSVINRRRKWPLPTNPTSSASTATTANGPNVSDQQTAEVVAGDHPKFSIPTNLSSPMSNIESSAATGNRPDIDDQQTATTTVTTTMVTTGNCLEFILNMVPFASKPIHRSNLIRYLNLGIKNYVSNLLERKSFVQVPDFKPMLSIICDVIRFMNVNNPDILNAALICDIIRQLNNNSLSNHTSQLINERMVDNVLIFESFRPNEKSLTAFIEDIRTKVNAFQNPFDKFVAGVYVGFVDDDQLSSSPYVTFIKNNILQGLDSDEFFTGMTNQGNFIVPVTAYNYFLISRQTRQLCNAPP